MPTEINLHNHNQQPTIEVPIFDGVSCEFVISLDDDRFQVMETRIRSGLRILLLIVVCMIVCGYSVSAYTQECTSFCQVLQMQPDFFHQFYSDRSTLLRVDGPSREIATSMLIQTELESGNPTMRLLYVKPELIITTGFMAKLTKVHARGFLNLIAIDEAHCISTWGHDFRPSYRKLASLRKRLSDIPMLALTATVVPKFKAMGFRGFRRLMGWSRIRMPG